MRVKYLSKSFHNLSVKMKEFLTKSGALIKWVDKETFLYLKDDFSVLLWVDYEIGIFNSGRVMRIKNPMHWDAHPENSKKNIEKPQLDEIVSDFIYYFKQNNKKFRVEMI